MCWGDGSHGGECPVPELLPVDSWTARCRTKLWHGYLQLSRNSENCGLMTHITLLYSFIMMLMTLLMQIMLHLHPVQNLAAVGVMGSAGKPTAS